MARGASSRSGPAPDPNALRRDRADDAAGWVTLPAAGRQGAVPEWPLSEPLQRELVLWAGEWRRPQAVEWERNGQELEVALFVRSLVDAEGSEATAAARTLVKQQMEGLGISLPGLHRNRWKIAEMPATGAGAAGAPVRSGLKVVQGGGGAA